uniref:Uncharacterized protein n=1 Tax=Setaria italica TaxID=4555 RepID=K3ZB28_SETIT
MASALAPGREKLAASSLPRAGARAGRCPRCPPRPRDRATSRNKRAAVSRAPPGRARPARARDRTRRAGLGSEAVIPGPSRRHPSWCTQSRYATLLEQLDEDG